MIILFYFYYLYLLIILLHTVNSIYIYSIISISRNDFIERSTMRNESLIIIIFYFNCNIYVTLKVLANINIGLKFSLILYYFNVNESNYICNTN